MPLNIHQTNSKSVQLQQELQNVGIAKSIVSNSKASYNNLLLTIETSKDIGPSSTFSDSEQMQTSCPIKTASRIELPNQLWPQEARVQGIIAVPYYHEN
jgi:hypothetical protein